MVQFPQNPKCNSRMVFTSPPSFLPASSATKMIQLVKCLVLCTSSLKKVVVALLLRSLDTYPRAEVIDSTTVATRALQTRSVGDHEAAFAIEVKLEKHEFLALEAFANGAMDDVMLGFNMFAFGFAVAIMMW